MPHRDEFTELTAWFANHLTGDEKVESQIVLEPLCQAFGHAGGPKKAGVTLEWRASRSP